MMQTWASFWAIIAIQFGLFLSIAFVTGSKAKVAARCLGIGALFGIPIGLIFDSMIGLYHGVFSYEAFHPHTAFFFLNSVLSYGIACGTVGLFSSVSKRMAVPQRLSGTFLALVSFALMALVPGFDVDMSTTVFGLGLAIIGLTEAVYLLLGFHGPFVRLFVDRKIYPFVRLWTTAILIGAVYEVGNFVFPVWHWGDFFNVGSYLKPIIIVTLGYVVLVSPLFCAMELVTTRSQRE